MMSNKMDNPDRANAMITLVYLVISMFVQN